MSSLLMSARLLTEYGIDNTTTVRTSQHDEVDPRLTPNFC